jgi:LAO/AO transport system kinase
MLAMADRGAGAWKPPIVVTTATTGEGIDDLVAKLDAHDAWLAESGERDRRRQARAKEEISAIAVAELRRRLGGLPGESRLDDLAGQVADGKLDPYTAADELTWAEQASPG